MALSPSTEWDWEKKGNFSSRWNVGKRDRKQVCREEHSGDAREGEHLIAGSRGCRWRLCGCCSTRHHWDETGGGQGMSGGAAL